MPSRVGIHRRSSSSSSECSDNSDHSRSTAPTVYSVRPSGRYNGNSVSIHQEEQKRGDLSFNSQDARSSVETYASTIASQDDLDEEYDTYEEPESYFPDHVPSAVPSTPSEFAQFFPSSRRLCIRHDDTVDGNMNLRIDTDMATSKGSKVDLTLFHLRMHDLKNREFSFRRYCRDSGREVCHSSRKYAKPASERRPGLQRSMSNALASLTRSKSDCRNHTQTSLNRHDSGYDSMSSDEEEMRHHRPSKGDKERSLPMPTNTTKLEFFNYAHLDLKRRGTKSSKRYEFEYWGTPYAWKRVSRKSGGSTETSYHLYNTHTQRPIAHIVPTLMTPTEAHEEQDKGGWVPPSSMWISDEKSLHSLTDVADVIVATGLIALVDDCIKSRWHRKDRFQFPIPLPVLPGRMINMEYLGPKRLIDEVFNRRGNTVTRHPTPLRQYSAEA